MTNTPNSLSELIEEIDGLADNYRFAIQDSATPKHVADEAWGLFSDRVSKNWPRLRTALAAPVPASERMNPTLTPDETRLAVEIADAWSVSGLAETAIGRRAKVAAKVALAEIGAAGWRDDMENAPDKRLINALETIARNEEEVFDECEQANVIVSMDAEDMAKIAYDALAAHRQKPAAPKNWRPEVRAFADLMEAKLREKDKQYNGNSWKGDHFRYLVPHLSQHTQKLINNLYEDPDADQAGRDAADVANFAMMIADVCGALNLPAPPTGQEGSS